MYSKKLYINAFSVIILILTAFIEQCQSRRRFNLKHHGSSSYETDNRSSDSEEEDTGPDIEHLAAKILLNSKDTEKSSSYEIVIKNSHRNKAHKDAKNFTLKDDKTSGEDYKIIRGNLKKSFKENVTPYLRKRTSFTIKDTIASNSNQEAEIILGGPKSNSNEYNEGFQETDSTAKSVTNLDYIKQTSGEYKVLRGNPKTTPNERLSLKLKNLEAHTHSKLENTKLSSGEDKVLRGNPKTAPDDRVSHVEAHTHSKLEITKQSYKEDKVITRTSKTEPDKGVQHTNLTAKNHKNLKDTKNKTTEDKLIKTNNLTKLNKSRDEVVFGKGKRNESAEDIVVTLHLTDKHLKLTKNQKPKLKQESPPHMVIRAEDNTGWSSEDEEAMLRDLKKAKAMRASYGDLCARVVVRKCLRAMKASLHETCKRGGAKCKANFRDTFKETAINGCYTKFDKKPSARAGSDDSMTEESRDNTGQCMPCLRYDSTELQESDLALRSKKDAEMKKVNILRDRYETACLKSSYNKCKAVGKEARDASCAKDICSKPKLKGMKEIYKKNCRISFKYQKHKYGSSSTSEEEKAD